MKLAFVRGSTTWGYYHYATARAISGYAHPAPNSALVQGGPLHHRPFHKGHFIKDRIGIPFVIGFSRYILIYILSSKISKAHSSDMFHMKLFIEDKKAATDYLGRLVQ